MSTDAPVAPAVEVPATTDLPLFTVSSRDLELIFARWRFEWIQDPETFADETEAMCGPDGEEYGVRCVRTVKRIGEQLRVIPIPFS